MTDKEDTSQHSTRRGARDESSVSAEGKELSFNDALKELGESMSDLASSRSTEALNSAIPLIKEAAERIRSEAQSKTAQSDQVESESTDRGANDNAAFAKMYEDDVSELYLDDNYRIAGVCAALARYFAMDTFTVRMLALTGLIFVPQVVFPAYWLCYFMLDEKSDLADSHSNSRTRRQKRRQRRRERRAMRRANRAAKLSARASYGWSREQIREMRRGRYIHPAKWLKWQSYQNERVMDNEENVSRNTQGNPESPITQSAANYSRKDTGKSNAKADLVAPAVILRKAKFKNQELEKRLRKLESFVTSKQFYLHKELHIIDK